MELRNSAVLVAFLLLAGCDAATNLTSPTQSSMSLSGSQATNYFVSPKGDDANPGTSQKLAWRTIQRVNAADFSPGDKVFFQGGATFVGELRFTEEDAGLPGAPVRVSSYGTGRATIVAQGSHGLLVYNAGYFEVRRLNVTSPDRTLNRGSGVLFYNDLPGNTKLSYLRVNNVTASGFGEHGIAIVGDPADGTKSGYHDVHITNSEAFDNARTGIATSGRWSTTSTEYAHSKLYVAHNHVHDNPGVPGRGNHSGSGIFLEDVDGAKVEYNVAHHNGALNDYPGGGPVGIWAAVANNITLQFNESHNNRSKTIDGGGFDFDGGTTNSVMQYNYSHDNDGAGYLIWNYRGAPHTNANLTVRYNVSQDDGRNTRNGAIQAGGATTGPLLIHNNTIILSRSPRGTAKGYLNAGSQNTKFWNNILVGSGGVRLVQITPRATSALQGNNYWATDGDLKMVWAGKVYGSYPAWRTASGQETLDGADTGLNVDPGLESTSAGVTLGDARALATLSAYRVRSDSPMVDAALDLQRRFKVNPGKMDFYRTPLSNDTPRDIGAAEAIAPATAGL